MILFIGILVIMQIAALLRSPFKINTLFCTPIVNEPINLQLVAPAANMQHCMSS
jgi:hypothetical protein